MSLFSAVLCDLQGLQENRAFSELSCERSRSHPPVFNATFTSWFHGGVMYSYKGWLRDSLKVFGVDGRLIKRFFRLLKHVFTLLQNKRRPKSVTCCPLTAKIIIINHD